MVCVVIGVLVYTRAVSERCLLFKRNMSMMMGLGGCLYQGIIDPRQYVHFVAARVQGLE